MTRNNEIQSELKELSSVVADIPFINVYHTPPDYFETLFIDLDDSVQKENDNSILDFNFKDNSTYSVPSIYFEDLPNQIMTSIQMERKVLNIKTYFNYKKIAAAACIVGLIGFFVYSFFMKNTNPQLDHSTATLINQAHQIIRYNRFETEINNLSEDDLVKYLEENGQDVEAALVASLSDESESSENELYFYDDQSFHNYLTDHNIYKSNAN